MKTMTRRKRIGTKPVVLVAEDDRYLANDLALSLEDEGFKVIKAFSGSQILSKVDEMSGFIDLILLDIMMPVGPRLSRSGTRAGYDTGLAVAREINKKYPRIRLIALTARCSSEILSWFNKYGAGYLGKPVSLDQIVCAIKEALRKGRHYRKPNCFVVHGHDDATVDELKAYLRNTLKFSRITVLREQPSFGRTIIEKFEEEAQKVDVAFILLTPDDIAAARNATDELKRRARQNVIFELGYFYAKLQRRSGSVILLHKGAVELPSDISGIIYVDITKGLASADRQIRRELVGWL